MAVVIDHSRGGYPAIGAALAFDAGQAQRRREEEQRALELWLRLQQLALQQQGLQQQASEFDARNRLQRDLAAQDAELRALGLGQQLASQQSQQQLQRDLASDRNALEREALAARLQQDRANRFYHAAAAGGGYGGYRRGGGGNDNAAYASILNNLLDNEAQASTQAAMADRQLAAQAAAEQRQLEAADMQGNIALRNSLLNDEPPEWLRERLDSGAFAYSPEQKTQMEQKKLAMQKLWSDPRISPQQRAAAQARLAQEYREIEFSPEPVPWDKRPKSLDQQFDEETIERGGMIWSRGRSGEWVPREVKDPQAELEIKRQESEWNIALDVYRTDSNVWADERPKKADYMDVDPETGSRKLSPDYDRDVAEWRKRRPIPPPSPWGQPVPGQPAPAQPAGEQPEAEQPIQVDPSGGAVTVWSPAQLSQVLGDPNVPPGTIIVWGPDGTSKPK